MNLEQYPINNPEIHSIDTDIIKVADISSHLKSKDYTFNSIKQVTDLSLINKPAVSSEVSNNYDDLGLLAEDIHRDGEHLNKIAKILGKFTINSLDCLMENIQDADFKYPNNIADHQEAYIINDFVNYIAGDFDVIPANIYKEILWISNMTNEDYCEYRRGMMSLTTKEMHDYIDYIFEVSNAINPDYELDAKKPLNVPEIPIKDDDEQIIQKYVVHEELQNRYLTALAKHENLWRELNKNSFTKLSPSKRNQLKDTRRTLNLIRSMIELQTMQAKNKN